MNNNISKDRLRAVYIDSVLKALASAGVKGAVSISINCKIKDLTKIKGVIRPSKAVATNNTAEFHLESEDSDTSIRLHCSQIRS